MHSVLPASTRSPRGRPATPLSGAKLRELVRLLSMAEELADFGHWWVDRAAGAVHLSPHAATIFGSPRLDGVPLRQLLRLIDPQSRRGVIDAARRALAGKSSSCGARLSGKAGGVRHLVLRMQADGGARRTASSLFGVVTDISDKLAADAALIEARDAAQAASEAKSRFLATMSHEIRTPMTGVMGMIELLRSDPDPDDREYYLDAMKQSAELLMAVLNDVLDVSKLASGNVVLESRDFDFEALAQSTLDLFFNTASRKGLLLTLEFDGGASPVARGDPVRLQQVLCNLIGNAVKFTDQGKIEVSFRARPRRGHAQSWRVTVRDTGPGIAPPDQKDLFEPFTQVRSMQSAGGTGLGLAISRSLVSAMGGRIGFRSGPARGATFWFEVTLPIGDASQLPLGHLKAEAPAACALKVLIAEDNSINQMLIAAMLRRMGHKPTCVSNGQLAVEAAATQKFDCVLMDMQMPVMDGMAATRAIRSLSPLNAATPIIALTADASPERRRFYDSLGLTAFMTKPIDTAEMAHLLDRIAEQRFIDGRQTQKKDSHPDESHETSPINPQRVAELRTVIGDRRVRGLMRMLSRELAAKPAQFLRLARLGDIAAVRSEAHSLKGAAMSIGADAVAQAALAIEQCPREELAAAVGYLETEAARALKALALMTPPREDHLQSA